jgi:hypothetical protein
MPLELSPGDFDIAAARVCRAASDYLAGLDGRPSFPVTSGAATAEVFDRPLPEAGAGSAAFDDLAAVADHSRPGNARRPRLDSASPIRRWKRCLMLARAASRFTAKTRTYSAGPASA